MMSTTKQRQLIGCLRKILFLDDGTYYEVLKAAYNVDSSKKLSYKQANELIEYFKNKAKQNGLIEKNKKNLLKYDNLGIRENMATPKQLRKINTMWRAVSRQETQKGREAALNKFIKKIAGCDHINFLEKKDVSKVIKAISAM